MGKRIFKRLFASFLALILAFLCGCFPSAFAAEIDERDIAVAIGDTLAQMGGLDGGWSLAIMSYFSANGISLESYGNTGEDLTRVIMKYYEEYYNEEIASLGGAILSMSDYIANAISGTALGISRIVGAVDGAFSLLVRAPLAVQLQDFLDWWNEKFNPSGSVETTETVEVSRNSSISAVTVPLANGDDFSLSILSNGGLLDLSFVDFGHVASFAVSDVALGTPLTTSSIVFLNNSSWEIQSTGNGFFEGSYTVNGSVVSTFSRVYSGGYLFATTDGICFGGYSSSSLTNLLIWRSVGNASNRAFYSFSHYYSSLQQFNSSGLSAVTMSQSSDGRLSYGPSGSSAGTIIQSGETISVPVVAPSIEGNAVSFSAVDTVADLLAKALTIVEDSVADAADTVLELPSTAGQLIPDIELFDDLDINWADDTSVSPSPSPSPVPDLPVTVVPTSLPSPWPVSPDQFAVVTSDGRTALVDITDTIKGWTESLTGIYQSYVDLLGSVFGFLPEQIQVLFKWSMAALIFTGVFKRFWWDHH